MADDSKIIILAIGGVGLWWLYENGYLAQWFGSRCAGASDDDSSYHNAHHDASDDDHAREYDYADYIRAPSLPSESRQRFGYRCIALRSSNGHQ